MVGSWVRLTTSSLSEYNNLTCLSIHIQIASRSQKILDYMRMLYLLQFGDLCLPEWPETPECPSLASYTSASSSVAIFGRPPRAVK